MMEIKEGSKGSRYELPDGFEKAPCDKCMSLCCISISVSKDGGLGPTMIESRAGLPCKHLTGSVAKCAQCSIYNKRAERGYEVCERYSCGSAGAIATEWFTSIFPDFDRLNTECKNFKLRSELLDKVFHSVVFPSVHIYELQHILESQSEAINPDTREYMRSTESLMRELLQTFLDFISVIVPNIDKECSRNSKSEACEKLIREFDEKNDILKDEVGKIMGRMIDALADLKK